MNAATSPVHEAWPPPEEVSKMEIREHTITFTLGEGDFEMSMRRKPKSREESDDWIRLCEKGLCNGHVDWDIMYECARHAMGEG